MYRAPLLVALVLAAPGVGTSLPAQEPATVSGSVTSASRTPHSGVLVRIDAVHASAITNGMGVYRLVIPAARLQGIRSFEITASGFGLVPERRTVTLSPGSNPTVNFAMRDSVVPLDQVAVTGSALDADDEPNADAAAEAAEQFLRAFDGRDWETFVGGLGARPTVVFPFAGRAERVTGRAAVEARFRQLFANGDARMLRGESALAVEFRGRSAVISLPAGDPPGAGVRTLVLVEEEGAWKIARLEAPVLQ